MLRVLVRVGEQRGWKRCFKVWHMIPRFALAFVLGLVLYLLAVGMTVYDGALSAIFQTFFGSVFTALALLALSIVGSPLLLRSTWRQWRRIWWVSVSIAVLGAAAILTSWHPCLRVRILDPETGRLTESFHPALAIGGWLAMMFGVAFCPLLGPRMLYHDTGACSQSDKSEGGYPNGDAPSN